MKHTVTITLSDDEYAQLKALAEEQDRYISAQARHMLRWTLKAIADKRMILAPLADLAGAGSAPESQVGYHHPGQSDFDGSTHHKQEPLPPEELGHSPKEPLPG